MEKQLIISVGREFGSGGHEIAEKLANHYGLQYMKAVTALILLSILIS